MYPPLEEALNSPVNDRDIAKVRILSRGGLIVSALSARQSVRPVERKTGLSLLLTGFHGRLSGPGKQAG